MSLLSDLKRVADSLSPSEMPSSADVTKFVGGLVKLLEHEGVTVADALIPEPEAAVVNAAAPAAAAAATTALEDLVARAEAAVKRLEGRADDTSTAGSEAPDRVYGEPAGTGPGPTEPENAGLARSPFPPSRAGGPSS